jgi:cytochrome P450
VLAAGNRDPAVFDQPDEVHLGRPNIARHVAFGMGPHSCTGQHPARIERCVMIREVVTGLSHTQMVGLSRWTPGKPRLLQNFKMRLSNA